MNAPTVYDIVVDDGAGVNGEYVGTLFGGIKFFLHQQVPSRSALEASIKVSTFHPTPSPTSTPLSPNLTDVACRSTEERS